MANGTIPASQADDLVIVCGVFIHPAAKDKAKILKYNYEATKLSIERAMKNLAHAERNRLSERHRQTPVRRLSGPMSAPKPKILIQLDVDPQPSVFDGVVAVDSGVDHLFRHGGVTPAAVRDLVHGALFTRGPAELCSTAIFVGGSDVAAAEAVLDAVKKTFFGPFKVSVLFDANGANTTAAAAVLAALESMDGSLEGVPAAVLAATGPVGQRAARLLCKLGAKVTVGSRSFDRAAALAKSLGQATGGVVSSFSSASAHRPRRRSERRQGRHQRRGCRRNAPGCLSLAGAADNQDADRLERRAAARYRRRRRDRPKNAQERNPRLGRARCRPNQDEDPQESNPRAIRL